MVLEPLVGRMARILVVAVAGLALMPALGGAAESCAKQVLNLYCLGGEFDRLLRQPPEPQFQQRDGERRAAIYVQGAERVYVMAFKNQIYKVVREHRPSTQMHHQEMLRFLQEKYGPPEDHSQYPKYAVDAPTRIAAIRRGEGQANHLWRAGQGWHLELSWTRELGLAVTYLDDVLDAEQHQATKAGL